MATNSGRVEGKVALVTGAASNPGLGYASAITLAREGAKVVLTDIDDEGGQNCLQEIPAKKCLRKPCKIQKCLQRMPAKKTRGNACKIPLSKAPAKTACKRPKGKRPGSQTRSRTKDAADPVLLMPAKTACKNCLQQMPAGKAQQ